MTSGRGDSGRGGRGTEGLERHGGELEATFYRAGARAQRDRLRVAAGERAATDALEEAAGIRDRALIERLAGLGIRAETLVALSLMPLVEVAWADGAMDAEERDAILAGAVSTGIREDGPNLALLRIWTAERPPPDLFELWRDFARTLCAELDPGERARFAENLVGRARRVAEAAGEITGRGDRVSAEEEAVLSELSRLLSS